MPKKYKKGYIFRAKPPVGKAFCLISLRAEEEHRLNDLGVVLLGISKRLARLKKGMTSDVNVDTKHRKTGNLTILYAYGQTFRLAGFD